MRRIIFTSAVVIAASLGSAAMAQGVPQGAPGARTPVTPPNPNVPPPQQADDAQAAKPAPGKKPPARTVQKPAAAPKVVAPVQRNNNAAAAAAKRQEAEQKRAAAAAEREKSRAAAQAKAQADRAARDTAVAKQKADQAKKQADQKAAREAQQATQKKAADEQRQKEEADRKAKADQARQARDQADADRKAKAEQARQEREQRNQPRPPVANTPSNTEAPPATAGSPPRPGTVVTPPAAQTNFNNVVRTNRPVIPTDPNKAKQVIRDERAKADREFEQAKREAQAQAGQNAPPVNPKAEARFENVRKQRRERVEKGGIAIIEEPDQRMIVRERDRIAVRHDDGVRLGRTAREARRERRADGTTIIVNIGIGGVEITTIEDQYGRLLRRSRRDRDGREIVLIDNRDYFRRHNDRGFFSAFVNLAPPVLRIPREQYIVEYDGASDDVLYDTLWAPPVEPLDRGYSLEEIRYSHDLRDRMRRVDLDTITFAFASWDVDEGQYRGLERIARVMKRILENNPEEIFLIEGHTDAVGSDIDNLSLSDRRAESVAVILSEEFQVPPENLTTQGYGEQYLKELTDGPSRVNRRVSVRRITPLLSSDRVSESR